MNAFVGAGNVNHADAAPLVMFDADQGSVQRDAANERLGPVDGIENPAKARRACLLAKFLAQNRIMRKSSGNPIPQQRFCESIRRRDGRSVGLDLDMQIMRPKPVQRRPPGQSSNIDGDVPAALEFASERGHGRK